MSQMGLFEYLEYIENPDEIFRKIFGRGICGRFGGQHDTLTSWDMDVAYRKAHREFVQPKYYEDESYQYSSNSFMKRKKYDDINKLNEEWDKKIYENILPRWWEMFLECITRQMHHIGLGNGKWQLYTYKEDRKNWRNDTWVEYDSIYANNAGQLLYTVFEHGEGFDPLKPEDNMYFVWNANRYIGRMTTGLVIKRWFHKPGSPLGINNGHMIWIHPTM